MSENEERSVYIIAQAGTSDQAKKEKQNGQAMPNPVSASKKKIQRTRRSKQKRNIAKDVTIRVCLSLSVFTYACIGGLVFHLLESDQNDVREKETLKWMNDTAIALATQLRLVTPHEEVWYRTIHRFLDIFQHELAVLYDGGGYIPRLVPKAWSFKNSVYFSISLMTATDNFEAVPRTTEGKISVIIFSIIGIPLTATWLVLLGEGLSSIWIHLFTLSCRCFGKDNILPSAKSSINRQNSTPAEDTQTTKHESEARERPLPDVKPACDRQPSKKKKPSSDYMFIPVVLAVTILLLYFVVGTTVITFTCDGWTIIDSAYAMFLTMATIGAKNLLPAYASSREHVTQIRKSDYFFGFLLTSYVLLSFTICTIYKWANRKKK